MAKYLHVYLLPSRIVDKFRNLRVDSPSKEKDVEIFEEYISEFLTANDFYTYSNGFYKQIMDTKQPDCINERKFQSILDDFLRRHCYNGEIHK